MSEYKVASSGFEDDGPPDEDVIGDYTGMRICVGYVGAEPQFIDQKELNKSNVEAACAWMKLKSSELSASNIAQVVLKWINAGRPVINNEEEISLSEFF